MYATFVSDELPRYYVEHYPPMLYDERDLESFDSMEEAEDFAEDCVRGGENARIFGEMARLDATGGHDAHGGISEGETYPSWLAA